MAGNNDRIHGYNKIYRSGEVKPNFDSFELMSNRRPDKFIYRPVNIVGGGTTAYDHQGHIVPQNMLNEILDPIQNTMAEQCSTLPQVEEFIRTSGKPWLQLIFNYADAIKAPMFDFDETDPENKVGNFFSIVTWNPINICRAPEDNRRKGIPGNTIDTQVKNYLDAHKDDQGVDTAWLASLSALISDPGKANIEKYIDACCNSLNNQLAHGIGYYAFPWQNREGVLSPESDSI